MSEPDRELLERYLSGDTSPDECARIEAWLEEDPDRWARLNAVRQALEDAALSPFALEQAEAKAWAQLMRQMGWTEDPRTGRPVRRSHRPLREFVPISDRPRHAAWHLAAALFVVVVGGAALGALLFHWRHSTSADAMRIVATKPGQRTVFRLSDGTQVVLGVASTLRYPAVFGADSREISLEGQAYFGVVHDTNRPFTVRAGDLVAKDLGTQFTVRAYPEDTGARVVVRQGRVVIRSAAAPVTPERVVAPGQLGRLRSDQTPTVEPADTAVWFAWADGRLVFDRTPLREALPDLSRWFDLEFRLADSALGSVPLTATFRTQPTTDVLNSLAASLSMRQRRAGRIVTLYSTAPGR
jgi:transmembrane sensor